MPTNYYYLVAGLPDLIFDSLKKVISLSEFIDELLDQVTPEHAEFLKLFRLVYDNQNLINLLKKKVDKFETGGNFTREELEHEIKDTDAVPQYMKLFLKDFKDEKGEMSHEDQLATLYYEEIISHPNEFVREWFTFDLNLRNLLTALNCRKMWEESEEGAKEFPLSRYIIRVNDFAEQIFKSQASDFALSKEYPWVEEILSLNRQNFIEFEKNIDLLRWKTTDDLTVLSYFGVEVILGFLVKLGSVERWQRLKPEVGEEMLGRLLAGFKSAENLIKDLQ